MARSTLLCETDIPKCWQSLFLYMLVGTIKICCLSEVKTVTGATVGK